MDPDFTCQTWQTCCTGANCHALACYWLKHLLLAGHVPPSIRLTRVLHQESISSQLWAPELRLVSDAGHASCSHASELTRLKDQGPCVRSYGTGMG